MVENIGKRKRLILKAIIQEHILKAEPIGSRSLTKSYDFGVSSATIRNEMSDLEDMGFLKQPHTSAGRIPSDRGYRFYVDVLMEQDAAIPINLKRSFSHFDNEKKGVQGIISGMVNMLSRLTQYTAMISEPELQQSSIRKLELIKVARKKLMIILVTDTGIVNNKIIQLTSELSSEQLHYINNYLYDCVKDKQLQELDQSFMEDVNQGLMTRINISLHIFKIIALELKRIAEPTNLRIYLGGTSYILDQPEFNDMNTLKRLLTILDHEENLRQLIENIPNDGIEVKIGKENILEEMENCSLVLATYHLGDSAVGKVGIIGPTRMEYPRIISTVDIAAEILSEIISKVSR